MIIRANLSFQTFAYLLNMICLNLRVLYKNFYICIIFFKFDTVLHQFLETGTSDRTLMGLDQLLKCLGFSLYPLLIFPLQFEIWDLKGSHSCGIVLPSYFP